MGKIVEGSWIVKEVSNCCYIEHGLSFSNSSLFKDLIRMYALYCIMQVLIRSICFERMCTWIASLAQAIMKVSRAREALVIWDSRLKMMQLLARRALFTETFVSIGHVS